MQAAKNSKAILIYIDIDNGKILVINEQLRELMPINVELTVEDIVCSTGAEIVSYSTNMYEKKEFRELVGNMVANYDMWEPVKEILRNSHIVMQFELKPLYIELLTNNLTYFAFKGY